MKNDREISVFCANVRRLRTENGLSKREMARKLGIGVKSLSYVEQGTLPPRLNCSVLLRIEHSFGVKAADMFREVEE